MVSDTVGHNHEQRGVTMIRPRYTLTAAMIVMMLLFSPMSLTASKDPQNTHRVSGKITATDIHRAGIQVDETDDHHMTLTEGEGTNDSTGKSGFMDGAQVAVFGTSDHFGGTGTGRGYARMSLDGDTVFLKHEGSFTSTMLSDEKLKRTMKGSFSFAKGSGRFKNISGTGTYKGNYISKKIYVIEWKGEYMIKK